MYHFGFKIIVALFTFAVGSSAFFVRNALQTPVVPREGKFVIYSSPTCLIRDNEPPVRPTPSPIIAEGILNGKAISKPAPAYPAIAKTARQQGTVLVQITINESGKVISARAVSGPPLLQQAAAENAYQARFSPTLLSGEPVKVSGTLTYNFVLE